MRLVRLLYFLGFQDGAGRLESWLFRRRMRRLVVVLNDVARGAEASAIGMQKLADYLRRS